MRTLPAILLLLLAAALQDPPEKLLAAVPAELPEPFPARESASSDIGLAWSADGQHAAVTSIAKGAVLLDGKEIARHAQSMAPALSADGSVLAYAARAESGRAWSIHARGKALAEGLDAILWGPLVSPDGTAVAFAARAGKKNLVVVGDKRLEFDLINGVDAVGPAVMSSAGRVAFWVTTDRSRTIYVDGAAGEAFSDVFGLSWSPDGKTLAHGAMVREGFKTLLVVGGERTEIKGPMPVRIFFGPEGKVRAWATDSPATPLVLDGEKVKREKGGPDGEVDAAAFSGTHVAWRQWNRNRTLQGTAWIVIDRKATSFENAGPPVAGPEDRFAYAVREKGKWSIVAGAARSAEFDAVGDPVWSADGKRVGFAARSGRELWWKSIEAK